MFLNLTAGLGAERNIPRPRMEYSVGKRVNPSDHVGGRMSCWPTLPTVLAVTGASQWHGDRWRLATPPTGNNDN